MGDELQIEKGLRETYFIYLDMLRETGVTNMFGAAPYLCQSNPELTTQQARDILKEWMETFGERHPSK